MLLQTPCLANQPFDAVSVNSFFKMPCTHAYPKLYGMFRPESLSFGNGETALRYQILYTKGKNVKSFSFFKKPVGELAAF